MFELKTPTAVKLAHLNVRAEKHGDETARAIDLKFTLRTSNEILDTLAPGLREALYFNAAADDGQSDVPGVPAVLPNRRFARITSLPWDYEQTGCAVVVDYGLGDEGGSNIELDDCKVNKLSIAPIEGGSVELAFRVQTSTVPDGALDSLSELLDSETQVTIVAPEPGVGEKELPEHTGAPIDGRDAGALFAEANAA